MEANGDGPSALPTSALAGAPAASSSGRSSFVAGLIRSVACIGADRSEKRKDAMFKQLQEIRIKLLRVAHRLGVSADNGIVSEVLDRFALAEQLKGAPIRNSGHRHALAMAMEMESPGQQQQQQQELDFCCNILLLGKSGVGKSATINSILDKPIAETDAFQLGTRQVRVISGTVKGIRVKFIDTPGLSPSAADRFHNDRIMSSVKRCFRRAPPDIVLYVDRLDSQSRDSWLLRFIADRFGPAIWFNSIIVLTHASSAPPDGPDGFAMNYDSYTSQKTRIIQQAVAVAVSDPRLLNPVTLVENNSACRVNRVGERVLPNGKVWRPELLLLCFSARILSEANTVLKLPESMPPKRIGAGSRRSGSPMPVLLASLLQSRVEVHQPEEEEYAYESEDSDEETEYDQLPQFRRLDRAELDELDKDNRRSYFEELALRERLYQKKVWKQQRKQQRERRAMRMEEKSEHEEDEQRRDMTPAFSTDIPLPPSFHSDDASHRFRFIDDSSLVVRPVVDAQGWDQDVGFDAAQLEKTFRLSRQVPVSLSGQVRKDKKSMVVSFDGCAAFEHSEDRLTTQAGLDVQTVGRDVCYNLWTGTCFRNHRRNKTMAGLGATVVGSKAAAGIRLEDKLLVGKRMKLVSSVASSLVRGDGDDAAYGAVVEATVVAADYPADRSSCSLGVSFMNWTAKDVAMGANLHSLLQLAGASVVLKGNVNNRGTGSVSVKVSTSAHSQIALVAILPILRAMLGDNQS